MLSLEELKHELKYFEYLDAAVMAYKLMSEGKARSFFDGIRKTKKIPQIRNISGSEVLLGKTILGNSMMKQYFILLMREEGKFIDFTSMQNDPNYITIRDKILQNDPNLTHADCNKIITQICNAIAHGDIIKSFDFNEFEKTIYGIYLQCGSPETKRPDIYEKYGLGFAKSASLTFNYESNFEIDANGNRVRRPRPVKHHLSISPRDISIIGDLVLSKYMQTQKVAFYVDPNTNETGMIDVATKNQTVFNLDEIQKAAFEEIKEEYIEYIKNNPKYFGSSCMKIAPIVALQKVLLGETFTFLKIRESLDVGINMPTCLKATKYDIKTLSEENYIKAKFHLYKNDTYSMIRSCFNSRIESSYKELLIVQIGNMLEEIEQNNLKRKVCSAEIFTQIAAEVFDKEESEVTDQDTMFVLDKIRNSIVHGRYINAGDEKMEIYDQISSSNKDIEHKFTLFTEDMESVKDACLAAFKEKIAELEPTTATVTTDKTIK